MSGRKALRAVEAAGTMAPAHLRPETAAWVTRVTDGWELDDHHRRLLVLAGEAFDRCQEAREAIAEHGLTYLDRFGAPRTRPEVAVERDSRAAFARLVAALDLDEGPVSSPVSLRPYRRRSP